MDLRGNSGPRMEHHPCLELVELVGQYSLRYLVTSGDRDFLDLREAWSWEVDSDEVFDERSATERARKRLGGLTQAVNNFFLLLETRIQNTEITLRLIQSVAVADTE